jgi:hypothetical protein
MFLLLNLRESNFSEERNALFGLFQEERQLSSYWVRYLITKEGGRILKKRSVLITLLVVVIVVVVFYGIIRLYKENIDFFNMFMSFSVTIDNQSDFDILSIETGLARGTEGSTKIIHEDELKSGSKITIRPSLHITGENGVYLEFTDSRGKTTRKSVCSYTESLSGHTDVTVMNDKVDVHENCN